MDKLEEQLENPKKDYSKEFCYECNTERLLHDEGYFACSNCGTVGGFINQNNFISQIWLKKKSIHKRSKWIEKVSINYINNKYIN